MVLVGTEDERESVVAVAVADTVARRPSAPAPALAAATVCVAMSAADTDTALETADTVLMDDDLLRLPHLYDLPKRTVGVI